MSKYGVSTKFCQLLGLKVPLIQSPMAGASTPRMASEVNKNGGLGSIPLGSIDLRKGIDEMRKEVSEFINLTPNDPTLVNLNFFCHEIVNEASATQQNNWWELYSEAVPSIRELRENSTSKVSFENGSCSFREIEQKYPSILLDVFGYLKEVQPKVVSFHFGIPSKETIIRLQKMGILVFLSVTSVDEARAAAQANIDGLVCQGYEAGGHRGNFLSTENLDKKLSTLSLFTQIQSIGLKHEDREVFVIPAGGITDGKTIDNYLKLGAAAVQMGTLFLATPESKTNQFYRDELERDAQLDTVMTSLVSGKRARAIKTPFLSKLIDTQRVKVYQLPPYGLMYNAFKDLKGLVKDQDLGVYFASDKYPSIKSGLTTCEVVRELSKDL
ncbi:2-nitropropane dioxygenase [Suhomyces tanzawaensis NRRL Y-17324]|uniref:2-nitropropane dioxygenase n=1 Tax=Suhomyces tanzawaensis NRRL Y-17324 TaxID=984487 RepID=A0A1E4SHR4_9ASCO|nr:2-nitropropane dioxygenase [Suhomyces tanzawaensis NRRL Y-17324]ODV79058.1 2-nitropropane dioxygenase [Suhomyces tanzawaensis NRRL Y-17324]